VKYDLNIIIKEKSMLNVDDIFLILHHHWTLDVLIFSDKRQRLQLAFLILISLYIEIRPKALIYKAAKNKKLKTHYLRYEDNDFNDIMNLWRHGTGKIWRCFISCELHNTRILSWRRGRIAEAMQQLNTNVRAKADAKAAAKAASRVSSQNWDSKDV
jgi:hypothetical protein